VLAGNVIGITGIGLLCSLVTGGLLAWTLPMGYMAFCQYALLEAGTAPWTSPVRPPDDRGAWICAGASATQTGGWSTARTRRSWSGPLLPRWHLDRHRRGHRDRRRHHPRHLPIPEVRTYDGRGGGLADRTVGSPSMRNRKEHAMPERDGYLPGVPCWADTSQPGPDAAAAFYRGLFGWEAENTMPPGSEAKYLVARLRGGDVAAISSPPDGAQGPPACAATP